MIDTDYRSHHPLIQSQYTPNCRAYAADEMVNLLRVLRGLPIIDISAAYIDTRAALRLGPHKPIFIDDCLLTMELDGYCAAVEWPEGYWGRPPSAEANAAAARHKIKWSAIQITDASDPLGVLPQIAARLAQGHPCGVSFGLTDEFWAAGGIINCPAVGTGRIVGAHAVAIYGVLWSRERVIVKNTWGAGWGDKGFGFLSFDWFRKSKGYRIPSACYVHELIETEIVTPPTGEPAVTRNEILAALQATQWTQGDRAAFLAAIHTVPDVPPVTPPVTPATGSVVYASAGDPPLIDADGNRWTLAAGGQIFCNSGQAPGNGSRLALDGAKQVYVSSWGGWYRWTPQGWVPAPQPA